MNLSVTNSNYCATVVQVQKLVPLENCDNVVAFPIFGYQAIVSKDTKIGDVGILFTAETQLTDDYCKYNNLYRHETLNADPTKKGYIEDNRRVKAVKFRGHSSSALFMPLQSLEYLFPSLSGVRVESVNIGDTFDTINDIEICRKYQRRMNPGRGNHVGGKNKVFERVDAKLFPEHLDSENYFRNTHMYNENDTVIITQKIHGTSGRRGHVRCKRPLNIFETVLKYLGVSIQDTYYDYIAGSRRVIKGSPTNKHFYESDVWTECLEPIKNIIPKNHIIYGEIIGWIGDKPIQKNYTYQIPQGMNEMYVYRISVVNDDGYAVDYTREQIKKFCKDNGIKYVPELLTIQHKDFQVEPLIDKRLSEIGYGCVPLDKESPCDEGICIRIDGIQPYICKAKSKVFLEHETKMIDEGADDLESNQSNDEQDILP